MEKELKHIKLTYTDKDLPYLDNIVNILEVKTRLVVELFEIEKFSTKVELFDTREKFEEWVLKQRTTKKVYDWEIGVSSSSMIGVLTLDEIKKNPKKANFNYEDMAKLIIHEFTHKVHHAYNYDNFNACKWLSEGLCVHLAEQGKNDKFTASLDEVINGQTDYSNYANMFDYVLDNYGKNYIMSLARDNDLLLEETPRLYEEVNTFYNGKKK